VPLSNFNYFHSKSLLFTKADIIATKKKIFCNHADLHDYISLIFKMSQNLNFPSNLQLTDLQVDNHNNFASYNQNDSFSMTDNNILQAPFVNALNAVSSSLQYCPHTSQSNTNNNGLLASNYFANLPNTTFESSQPQVNRYDVYKFEIPGFEIIIRPKSNQVMNFNQLSMQSYSSMNSYSPGMSSQQSHSQQSRSHQSHSQQSHSSMDSYSPGMSSQLNQNYVDGNSASGSYANSDMITMNMQNIYNNQPFINDNLQYQSQQQNSLGYNSYHG
jgi:hypothetical protein